MKQANIPAHYIIIEGIGAPRFVTCTEEGDIGTSTSPHAATLFTSKPRAESIHDAVREAYAALGERCYIVETRTHCPQVLR